MLANPLRSTWLETPAGTPVSLRDPCTIGRSKSNVINVFCERASRRHALVRRDEDGRCSVIDLGSSNGTFVNGQRVNHLAHLEPGDVIEVGSQRFILHAEAHPNLLMETPATQRSGGPAPQPVPSWLLIGDREETVAAAELYELDHRFKTSVSWTQVCQRVVQRYHGWLAQDAGESLCAYWPDPTGNALIARSVSDALRELRSVQQRPRSEFRLALHFGTVEVRSLPAQRRGLLSGAELEMGHQMQALAWVLSVPCLVSAEANTRLAPLLPTYALEPCGLESYEGERQFYRL